MRMNGIAFVAAMAACLHGAEAKRPAPTFHFFPIPPGEASQEQLYAAYPKTFSATGFYSDFAARTVGPGIYAFDINSPLWSDGAGKSRYLILPRDSVVGYLGDDMEFDFPDGAVFVKHFWIDTVENRPASRVFIETRMLVRQGGQWRGLSYKWRKDQSDADLHGGPEDTTEQADFFITLADGTRRKKTWLFPGRAGFSFRNLRLATCNSCHLNRTVGRRRDILGFISPQLTLAANGKDQIRDLIEQGYMVLRSGASYAASTAHRWYALDDSTSAGSTPEKRVRSYFASNCSHCHSPGGAATCIPVFTYNTAGDSINYIGRKSGGVWGLDVPAGDTARFIYPGKPELSVILRRISAADADGYRDTSRYDWPGVPVRPAPRALAKTAGWDGTGLVQMPPLATYEPNPLATRVIRDWIRGLPAGYTGGVSLQKAPHAHESGGKAAIRPGGGLMRISVPIFGDGASVDARGRILPPQAAHP
jgi:hypothetical protein